MQISIDWTRLDWNEIEAFFYRAMLTSGYPSEKPNIWEEGGHRKIRHQEGLLRLEDIWTHTPHSEWSAGTTTIYREVGGELAPNLVPIWVMQYSGFYRGKTATLYLKKILREAYQNPETSLGCRGPREVKDAGFKYNNVVETFLRTKFFRFAGWEELWNVAGNRLAGRHFYRGTALVG